MNIEDIIVRVVNQAKLIDFLAIQLEENQELLIDSFAVWESKFIVDTDVCFGEIHSQHFNDKIQPVLEIDCRIKKYDPEKNSWSYRLGEADFSKIISLKDYLEMSTEIKLVEFIRYNYNPRITSNQRLFMEHCKAAMEGGSK